jgi:hypothetical protein
MIVVTANVGLLASEIGKMKIGLERQEELPNRFIECIRLPITIAMLTS